MTPQAALVADPFTHTAGFGGLRAVIAAVITAAGVAVTLLSAPGSLAVMPSGRVSSGLSTTAAVTSAAR